MKFARKSSQKSNAKLTREETERKHKADRLQCTFLEVLGELGDPLVSADIQKLSVDNDEYVRMHIVTAAVDDARRCGRDYAKVLEDFFHDGREEVRDKAVSYATWHPDEKFIGMMAPLFYAGTPAAKETKDTAPKGPAQSREEELERKILQQKETIRNLEEEVRKDNDSWTRRTARDFVLECQSQDAECVAPVLKVLADPACVIEGRIMAARSLAYPHAIPAVVDALLDVLDSDREALHGYAARSLGFVTNGEPVIEELQKRLQAPRTDEIGHHLLDAVGWLAERYPVQCVPILESYLERSGYEALAMIGLSHAGARQDVARLRKMYDARYGGANKG